MSLFTVLALALSVGFADAAPRIDRQKYLDMVTNSDPTTLADFSGGQANPLYDAYCIDAIHDDYWAIEIGGLGLKAVEGGLKGALLPDMFPRALLEGRRVPTAQIDAYYQSMIDATNREVAIPSNSKLTAVFPVERTIRISIPRRDGTFYSGEIRKHRTSPDFVTRVSGGDGSAIFAQMVCTFTRM